MQEAKFYKKLKDNQVQCQLCNHYCMIKDGKTGVCRVRQNKDGVLYSLVYGQVITQNIDPIEKKPLYHFLPKSETYSIATVGCNFKCAHCQNSDISQISGMVDPLKTKIKIKPEDIVNNALENNCLSIAYTYTEPTIFAEFAIDCMKLARKNDLKNVWVSNGYTSSEAWPDILPYLDAINVDLKFFKEETYQKICGVKLQPVLDNLKLLKENNIWLEVTTLIIPTLNDSDQELKQIAEFIKNELGDEVPWHLSAFYPTYKLNDLPAATEESILRACKIGKEAGLKYIYCGNVNSQEFSSTYCPKCNELIVERKYFKVKRFDKEGFCNGCGNGLDGVF